MHWPILSTSVFTCGFDTRALLTSTSSLVFSSFETGRMPDTTLCLTQLPVPRSCGVGRRALLQNVDDFFAEIADRFNFLVYCRVHARANNVTYSVNILLFDSKGAVSTSQS
jgi:hypothetical protein